MMKLENTRMEKGDGKIPVCSGRAREQANLTENMCLVQTMAQCMGALG